MTSAFTRLAGEDGPNRRALPAGEFFHPISLAAVAVLAINDWWLKGSGSLPGAVTGKLSDVAGVVFFPLLCTAVADCALYAVRRLGADTDPSLRHGKLTAALLATAAIFVLLKLVPGGAAMGEALLGAVGIPAAIAADPTDLVALPALAIPWWIGRREIARLPLGRLEVLLARYAGWRYSATALEIDLDDLVQAGACSASVRELAAAVAACVDRGDRERLEQAIAALRQPRVAELSGSPAREPNH